MNDPLALPHRVHLVGRQTAKRRPYHRKAVVRGPRGSERNKVDGDRRATRKEAQAINKSLSALGNVISALAGRLPHPYRDHKLPRSQATRSGGNAKTLMFVNDVADGLEPGREPELARVHGLVIRTRRRR
jgi:hypothetical protein